MSPFTSTPRHRRRRPLTFRGNGRKGITLSANGAASALAHSKGGKIPFPVTRQWPDGSHFVVLTDNTLGKNAIKLAQGVLAQCEADYNQLVEIFGGPRPSRITVLITSGPDAEHTSCSDPFLLCGSSGANVGFTNRLLVMEEVEVFAALQNNGWYCKASNGEALSRVLAEQFHPPQGKTLIAAPFWLEGKREDYVTKNSTSDQEREANGCAALFLYYLRYQLRFSWQEIVQTGGDTLAKVYKKLTGKDDAFESFKALMQIHFPQGTPSGLKRDNPFPLPCKP